MAIGEFLEPAIKDYATQAKATYSAPINTSTFAQKVAPQDAMTTQAAGLATQGVGSYSPYLQAAQTAQASGAGALGQSASTIGGIGANIGQAGTTLGGVGTNIGQADTSLANAQSAYGGLGQFQAGAAAASNQAGSIANQAGNMTGANAYQPFMSPYQQQVIDATLSEFDRSRLGGQQQIRDQAVASGNFGGGREGAMLGQYNADSLIDRSALNSQMLQQGFGQAQQQAQQNFQNQGDLFGMQQGIGGMQANLFNQQAQMGGAQQGLAQSQLGQGAARQSLAQSQLGQGDALARQAAAQQGLAGAYGNQMNQQFGLSDFNRSGMGQDINALGSLGAANQAQAQAQLNATRMNEQTAAYEPYGRLSQYGNALTGLAGGVAGQQYQQEEASDPYASALAGATGVAGLFGQIYGGRRGFGS